MTALRPSVSVTDSYRPLWQNSILYESHPVVLSTLSPMNNMAVREYRKVRWEGGRDTSREVWIAYIHMACLIFGGWGCYSPGLSAEARVLIAGHSYLVCGEQSGTRPGASFPEYFGLPQTLLFQQFPVHLSFIYHRCCLILAVRSVVNWNTSLSWPIDVRHRMLDILTVHRTSFWGRSGI
jgi:hypothetical protein